MVANDFDTILRLCAPNDRNGNPRRVYVAFALDDNHFAIAVNAWDEGYEGWGAVPAQYRERAQRCLSISVPAAEYKRFLHGAYKPAPSKVGR